MIEIKDIIKTYQMGEVRFNALAGVSLKIQAGEFVAIMGPSGSGKSTLMQILGLLDSPTSGSYQLQGREVSSLSEDELAKLRGETIGYVFQQFNLLARTSALDNVALPMVYGGGVMDKSRAKSLLEKVGLGERLHHKPNELSGGQQQRVAIARALVNGPSIIFADEPTGNLDSESTQEIMQILVELNRAGITIILVTHEQEIGEWGNRIIRVLDGKIQSDQTNPNPRAGGKSAWVADRSAYSPKSRWQRSLSELRTYFTQGITALAANKVRTALSMLGILIGVAAVVAMLAVGNGAKKSMEEQLSSLGSNLLMLMPGSRKAMGVALDAGTVTRLTVEDASDILRNIPEVAKTGPMVSGRVRVTFANKNWGSSLTGAVPDYFGMHNSSVSIGRIFTVEEERLRARVVVLGMTVVRELFGDQSPLGEMVKINKTAFQVIGVLKEKGSSGWRDQDDTAVVPLSTAMHRLLGKTYVDAIDIEVSRPEAMAEVEESVRSLIIARHHLPASLEDSFQVRNMAEIQDMLSATSRIMSLLLAVIAGISLLVGGIGIMNIMLVSVTERTREIGLRKAIGARRVDILSQFLVESILVSTAGGIAGLALGTLITVAISFFAGWSTAISISSVVLALFFSSGIGLAFGLWPARKAARLSPIVALRYE
jgi:macrolide transport system ATP-binding/permease protein